MVAFTQADDSQRRLANLAEKWNITEPTFKYDSLSFALTFTVSYFVATAPIAGATLWDVGCKEGLKSITAGGATGIKFFETITTRIEPAAGNSDLLNRTSLLTSPSTLLPSLTTLSSTVRTLLVSR